jgi:polygalacturonase
MDAGEQRHRTIHEDGRDGLMNSPGLDRVPQHRSRVLSRALPWAVALVAILAPSAPGQQPAPSAARVLGDDPWAALPEILARIQPPVFPARDFLVTAFGAKGDGKADCTDAFRKAIAACSKAGGGRVLVPAGRYLTGAIHLLSNVNLHVTAGATVLFSQDPAKYLPVVLTRFEGVEMMNYSPLVYAREAENVAITGEGTLDGQADAEHWWPWKNNGIPESQKPDRDRLFQQAEDGVPVEQRVYGAGHYLRPSFIEPYASRNVLIEGVTIKGSPFWVIHPTLSKNVTVRNVKVVSEGPNNDGCDPESSEDVLIEDSLFDTGDDCIALKSGRNADGRRVNVPMQNVVIRGCKMRAGHGGVTIGSEVSGGVRNVYAERCLMSSPNLDRGLRIKTNSKRGGVIENVFVRDIEIGDVQLGPIDITMRYEPQDTGPYPPVIRNIRVERMTSRKSGYALFVQALDDSPVRGLLVRDSVFRGVEKGSLLEGLVDIVLENVTVEPRKK